MLRLDEAAARIEHIAPVRSSRQLRPKLPTSSVQWPVYSLRTK